MRVGTHSQIGVGGADAGCRLVRPRGQPQKWIGDRPGGHSRLVVEYSLVNLERNHVQIHSAVRVFWLVEDAVSAADHCPRAERLPCESDARTELTHVILRNLDRHTCPAARTDEGSWT